MKLKIKIEDKLFLESDERQYILKQYNGKFDDDGNEKYRVLGYFGAVENAFNKVFDMKLKETTSENVQQLVEEIVSIRKELKELFGYEQPLS